MVKTHVGAIWWLDLCEDSSLFGGPGFDPRGLQKNFTLQKRGFHVATPGWPRGTLSFSMIHACMCQTKIGPCPPLANLAAKSAEMSHVHVILYSRMVSCHVAYTDCTVSICMFGKTYRMQYLSHTNYV
jgi:hypothetical protein